MVRTLAAIVFLVLVRTVPGLAQHGVVHFTLKDRVVLSAYVVYASQDTLYVQPDIARFKGGLRTAEDTAAVYQRIRRIPIDDIMLCEIERSSIAYPYIFPGVAVATGVVVLVMNESEHVDGLDAAAAMCSAVLCGGILATVIHAIVGYDIEMDSQSGIALDMLRKYAFLPDGPPERINTDTTN